jgi:hypothetical protein
VKSLLDTGMLLLVTAKRFDRDSRSRANCLDGAKRCQLRVEEDLWKFEEPSELSQLSAGIDRLRCEFPRSVNQSVAARGKMPEPFHSLDYLPRGIAFLLVGIATVPLMTAWIR